MGLSLWCPVYWESLTLFQETLFQDTTFFPQVWDAGNNTLFLDNHALFSHVITYFTSLQKAWATASCGIVVEIKTYI